MIEKIAFEIVSVWCIDCVFLLCRNRLLAESSLWNSLNVKEIRARNKRGIWNLSDWNEIRNHTPLTMGSNSIAVTHQHLWVWITLKSLKFHLILRFLWERKVLTFRQFQSDDSWIHVYDMIKTVRFNVLNIGKKIWKRFAFPKRFQCW